MNVGRFVIGVLVLAAAFVPARPAVAIPLQPGESMLVRFHFPGDPVAQLGEIDTLSLILNATCSGFCGAPSARFELFDGSLPLGDLELTFAQPFTTFAFYAPSSVYRFRAGVVSDFSSIANGTIDGRLRITNISVPNTIGSVITNPLFDFSVQNMPGGSVGRATQSNGYNPGGPDLVIDSQTATTVPEPGTMLMLGTGLAAASLVRRRRR